MSRREKPRILPASCLPPPLLFCLCSIDARCIAACFSCASSCASLWICSIVFGLFFSCRGTHVFYTAGDSHKGRYTQQRPAIKDVTHGRSTIKDGTHTYRISCTTNLWSISNDVTHTITPLLKSLVDVPHNSKWTSIYRYDNAQSLSIKR